MLNLVLVSKGERVVSTECSPTQPLSYHFVRAPLLALGHGPVIGATSMAFLSGRGGPHTPVLCTELRASQGGRAWGTLLSF